jgi:hypothetical protein
VTDAVRPLWRGRMSLLRFLMRETFLFHLREYLLFKGFPEFPSLCFLFLLFHSGRIVQKGFLFDI